MSPALRLMLFHFFCDTPWYFMACVPLYNYLKIKKAKVYMLMIGVALLRMAIVYLPSIFYTDWMNDNIAANAVYYLALIGLFFYAFNIEIIALVYVFLLTYTLATSVNYVVGLILSPLYPGLDKSTTIVYTIAVLIFIIIIFPFLYRFFKGIVANILFEVSPKEFKMLCVTPVLFLVLVEMYIYISQQYGLPRFSAMTGIILVIGLISCFVNLRMVLDSARHSKKLREVNVALEEKVKARTREYQEQALLAETANKAKTSFLAMVSHEIRTPLNAIIGLSQVQMQKKLPKDVYENFETIYGAGTSLLMIINEILDISKIESGSFELIPVNYSTPSLINDIVQLNMVHIKEKPITFELSVCEHLPEQLCGDEQRIRQVLNNLLSNAFKYTKSGTVRLTVKGDIQDEYVWITVIVEDTGIGVREEDIDKLFQEYSRLDIKANRKIEGTGLGLAITKKLLELMDGSISVESQYGKGSAFTATFMQKIVSSNPIGKTVAGQLQKFRFWDVAARGIADLKPSYMPYGKVLVVDDVATNLDVARGLMQSYGLQVDCVLSGREAIERIRDEKVIYDIVFMDHMMPEMDGMEATKIIRGISNYAKNLPIIALSANVMTGNVKSLLLKGFTDFVSKPIDILRLDAVLNQYIQKKEGVYQHLPQETISQWTLEHPEEIDVDMGIVRYGGVDEYLQVLRSYMMHTPQLLEMLGHVTKETLPDYAIAVHGLKGSSYGICADDIAKQAEILEIAAKEGNYEAVKGDNLRFIHEVNHLLGKLNSFMNHNDKGNGITKKEIRFSPEDGLLIQLKEACKVFRISEMKTCMDELERYEYETKADLIAWLRKQIDCLEYDAIVSRLEDMG